MKNMIYMKISKIIIIILTKNKMKIKWKKNKINFKNKIKKI